MPTSQSYSDFCRSLSCFALLLAAACLSALGQTGPSNLSVPSAATRAASSADGSFRIAGTVVNAITGEPVRGATVAALAEADSRTVTSAKTGDDGHFSLERLRAAKYQLTASKRGFRTAFYDEHEEFSTAIVTGAGQQTESLIFRMTPGAVLRGVVTADGGDLVESAKVMLFLKPSGHKAADRITQADETTTDDLGAYEFSNLAAGEYLLAVKAEPWYAMHRSANRSKSISIDGVAEVNTALDVAYPITFFDSATDEASAAGIVLAGGGHDEADINLHAVPALHLAVETPRKPDGSIARAELRQNIFGIQVSAESAGVFLDAAQTGTAEYAGVAPGHYELVQGDPPRIADLDATASQQIDAGLGTLTVVVSGTVRNASGAALPGRLMLSLDSLDGTHPLGGTRAEGNQGRFTFPSVPPGAWELSAASCDAAGQCKPMPVVSITAGGTTRAGGLVTVPDKPLAVHVNVSDGETRVQGFARKGGKGVAGVMVVLAPKDLSALKSLARRDQSDSDGSFSLRDVAPGQYTVVAIQDGWDLDWTQPEVIGRYLPRGIAVTVSDKSGKLVPLAGPVPVQSR
jgi:uncharacterized surface anchored protein